jgi:hypothetical protein
MLKHTRNKSFSNLCGGSAMDAMELWSAMNLCFREKKRYKKPPHGRGLRCYETYSAAASGSAAGASGAAGSSAGCCAAKAAAAAAAAASSALRFLLYFSR